MSTTTFERPVIVLSAPRSGSTLLYEVLSHSRSLWTIGGESHGVIEAIPQLNVARRGFDSNALSAADLDDTIRDTLLAGFRERTVLPADPLPGPLRFLEKTPKNSLRVPFLDCLFPDAYFIFLVRDARENISSIMNAWRSQRFVTYPRLPGWDGGWSLLLPPDWQSQRGRPLHQVAAFQWQQANEAIIGAVSQLTTSRWCMTSYAELVSSPAATIERLCQLCDLPYDEALQQTCAAPLPHSRYTLSAPVPDKWRADSEALRAVWPQLQPTVQKINALLAGFGAAALLDTWPDTAAVMPIEPEAFAGTPRNAPCPCGSGRRYKQCHGALA